MGEKQVAKIFSSRFILHRLTKRAESECDMRALDNRLTRGGRATGRRWAVGLLIALAAALAAAQEPQSDALATRQPVARLIVDYGDGVEKHFTRLPCRDGETVFGLMEAAMRHQRGIKVKYRGKGATMLVEEIDELQSQAAGAGSRNWIYRINGQVGRRSAGVSQVKAGDTVLWSFETYR
jgi:hypothetical protein